MTEMYWSVRFINQAQSEAKIPVDLTYLALAYDQFICCPFVNPCQVQLRNW